MLHSVWGMTARSWTEIDVSEQAASGSEVSPTGDWELTSSTLKHPVSASASASERCVATAALRFPATVARARGLESRAMTRSRARSPRASSATSSEIGSRLVQQVRASPAAQTIVFGVSTKWEGGTKTRGATTLPITLGEATLPGAFPITADAPEQWLGTNTIPYPHESPAGRPQCLRHGGIRRVATSADISSPRADAVASRGELLSTGTFAPLRPTGCRRCAATCRRAPIGQTRNRSWFPPPPALGEQDGRSDRKVPPLVRAARLVCVLVVSASARNDVGARRRFVVARVTGVRRRMAMFTHLLLPTDGSPLSEMAIRNAVELAKSIHAKVTGFYVMPRFHLFTYRTEMLEETKEQYARDSRAHAHKYLAAIETAANEAGVPCETAYTTSDHPYEAIVKAAEERHCDLIAMASHGRKGVQGIVLGSETNKVLTHTRIPVLVYR